MSQNVYSIAFIEQNMTKKNMNRMFVHLPTKKMKYKYEVRPTLHITDVELDKNYSGFFVPEK